MNVVLRVVITFISFVATFYFVFWTAGALVVSYLPPLAISLVSLVAAVGAATGVAVYVWMHTKGSQRGLLSSIVTGGLITGGIGFVAGFFGPILFAPDANQGPLLGLFITGPLGFVLGAIGGAIYWFAWGRRAMQRSG